MIGFMKADRFIRVMQALAFVLGLSLGMACESPPDGPGSSTTRERCDPDVERCAP
jgi:hypothetical protein